MRVCPSCGAENGEGADFCSGCGDYLDWDRPAEASVADRRVSWARPTAPPEHHADAAALPAGEAEAADQAWAEAERARAEAAAAALAAAAEAEAAARARAAQAAAEEAARVERIRRLVAPSAALPNQSPDRAAASLPTPAPARSPGPPGRVRTAADEPPGSLASVITIAERSGRTDLSSRLRASRESLRRTDVSVAIVGEFKKGKSSLLNALVNAEVCPADPVCATVVPIVVSNADELSINVELLDGGTEPATGLDQVAELASEIGNLDNHLAIARIEVGLPRRLLATGLTLVDTPGVGGLDSAIAALVLARLDVADGVLFVTDCSQELTAPELNYVTSARQRCDSVVCVMTKLDLYPDGGMLADKNRRHLDAAGLTDVPIVAVSSVLHLLALAETDPGLEEESNFEELFEVVHRRIWEPARRRGLAGAGLQMASVAAHLTIPLEAEREAARSAESAARTIARLREMQDRVRQLRSGAARWQQRLADGMQEAMSDLDHDLRNRIRVVGRTADGHVDTDADNPADDLVFEVWLHKAAMEAVLAHYGAITDRTSALAAEVAEQFVAFDRDSGFQVEASAPTDRLASIHVVRESSPLKDGVLRRVITTTQGYSSGLVLASSMLAIWNPVTWLPLLTVPVAGYMARRAFSDDRVRRKAMRTQELKRLASRYLDEISFVAQKDSRDTVRRLHREIREHFTERTDQLDRTLQQAVEAAERIRADHAAGTIAPAVSLQGAEDTIRQMRTTAELLVATAPLAS